VASRLYRTTRPLYLQVTQLLDQLGVAVGSPTTAVLIALYVTDLILLDARPTQTRVANVLPGRCHDALNRLLRTTPWSTLKLLAPLVAWIPVAFRLWRPKRSCAPAAYQTKLQLAAQMLTELVAARLPFQYLVMDTHYTAGWFARLPGRLGIC
jgi:hypothetical protein